MKIFQVNQELCNRCGICAAVCPGGIVAMTEAGPQVKLSRVCMACGHCVAACPNAALDNIKAPLAKQKPLSRFPVLEPETAATFLRSRRSIRHYRKEPVVKEKILQLLEIARFAPSGGNSQGLSYLVVDRAELLRRVTTVTIEWLESIIATGAEWAKRYTWLAAAYRKSGVDVVLREAPCLILATAPQRFELGPDNARFALEYVELYATTLGLGTCWAGFVEMCAAADYPPLRETLNLPNDQAVVGALMAGYPQHTYKRMVDRDPLRVRWAD